MRLTILPMDRDSAETISRWHYPGEYAVYDMEPGELDELLGGEYYAAFDAAIKDSGELVGFFCYGSCARVPTDHLPDPYAGDSLDVGLGMRPDLCGQGNGAAFLRAGVDFAQTRFGVSRFRLTVMTFNSRAIHAYESAGFEPRFHFVNHAGTARFQTMTLELSPAGKGESE